jgi:hypothetical protein
MSGADALPQIAASDPPLDCEVLIFAPELSKDRWLRAVRSMRRGCATARYKVFGIKGYGLSSKWNWLYRDFQPQAWKPASEVDNARSL